MIDLTDSAPNWDGLPDSSEHRTVGPHRAMCHTDSEWCYPESLCWCCDQMRVPKEWKGLHVAEVLIELHRQVNALAGAGDADQRGKSFYVRLDDVQDLLDGKGE